MKYVFVCKHGEDRSPTCARIAKEIAKEQGIDLNTTYVGTTGDETEAQKRKKVLDANRVFIMEEGMRYNVEKIWDYTGPILCLNIPDEDLSDERIKSILELKLPPFA